MLIFCRWSRFYSFQCDDDDLYETDQFTNEEFPLEFDDFDFENLNKKIKYDDSWILLWIFKFQERFKLPDVMINSLIGFFSIVLKDAGPQRFSEFPLTAYMTRKILEINKKSKMYAVCSKCNKLHNVADIVLGDQNDSEFSGFRCDHIEFPDHPMQNQRKSCRAELLTRVPVVNRYIWKPKIIYPLPCLKIQLATMYQ